MKQEAYVIGVDFGTDSVRSLLVNAHNGTMISASTFEYPRWKQGLFCNPTLQQYRQHPLDFVEGLQHTIQDCVMQAGPAIAAQVVGISIATTGSTPIAVNKDGTPLALLPNFEQNPNAMFLLWKDHTATQEAAAINTHAATFATNYLQFVGGIYSSEWFWAKLLHLLKTDELVRQHIHSFVEHCDWIPFLLTGQTGADNIKRSVCAAGHKALWATAFNGLPPNEFFCSLHPYLDGFTQKLFTKTYTTNQAAGTISPQWAASFGLPSNVLIGIGAFDCHVWAVGGQIAPYYLSKVMGTSTCDMLVAPAAEIKDVLVKGICGQVDGSIIPNMIGMEAGQSAFGDAFAWFKSRLEWPIYQIENNPAIQQKLTENILKKLSEAAEKLPLNNEDELAVDWLNGRRTPDANQTLKAAITNLHLASDAPRIFKALVEAACFGSKAIVDRFTREGIAIKGIIALGGVAQKSHYTMQVMANVLNMPIRIHTCQQTCAHGAAMFAATIAGIHPSITEAMHSMGQGFETTILPQPETVAYYKKRYTKYQTLGQQVEQATTANFSEKSIELPIATPLILTAMGGVKSHAYEHIQQAAYEANMQLPQLGLVLFTFGNVSAADSQLGVFAIKPSGVAYKNLTPAQMVFVDFNGKVVAGKLRLSSYTQTHAVLYKHWPAIGGIAHTHSTYATAWAQAQRSLPIYGTTHADYAALDIPCAPPMNDENIQGQYEKETGWQIINHLKKLGLHPMEIEMILVANHAPFTWGKDAAKAVHNSAVLETIAHMATLTEQINPNALKLKEALVHKHFKRKHGPAAYYGQL